MNSISATNSSTISVQISLLQGQLVQARQQAQQDERRAQQLQQLTNEAQQQALGSRENVRELSSQAQQVQSATYSPQPASSALSFQAQDFLQTTQNALNTNGNTPVLNAQGQTTGLVLQAIA